MPQAKFSYLPACEELAEIRLPRLLGIERDNNSPLHSILTQM
jgi:hypothetical protein